MLESIKLLFEKLNNNSITYCHWKSNEHLDPALDGDTDLDVLFMPSQRSELDVVLNECGLKRFRAMPLSQYNAIEDYIGFDKATAKIWHLHLHQRLTLGEKHLKGYTITPWNKILMANRRLNENGVYIASPYDELVLLYVRMALKLQFKDYLLPLSKDDYVEISWLNEQISEEILYKHAEEMLNAELATELIKINKNKINKRYELKKFANHLRVYLFPFTGNYRIIANIKILQRTIFWLIGGINHRLNGNASVPYSRVSPAGGCVISFIGSDGAGKSTTIKYLRDEFSKKLDVKTVYLGSGDGSSSLLRKPMIFVAKRVGGKGLGATVEEEYKQASDSKKISLKSRLYSVAKILWAVTLAYEKQSKLREITKARNNGMVVLLDRYPQIDVFGYNDGPLLQKYAKGKGLLSALAHKEYSIYASFYKNKPDVTIKLIAPVDIALERKPEMTKKEIEDKIETIMNMKVSDIELIVDTSENKNITFGNIMEIIWKNL